MSFLGVKHFLNGENMTFLMKLILLLMLLIAIILIIYCENNFLEKTRYIYKSKKIPKSFDGFKIIQISDLHDKTFGRDNKNLIKNSAKSLPIFLINGFLKADNVYCSY